MSQGTACRRIELDAGYVTEVRDEGTGPAVVLLHATPLDRRVWDGVFERLPGRRLIAYDLRGHGSAQACSLPSFYGPLTDDLDRLLDACEIDCAHLVGHGYGGEVAQAFAVRFPGRVRSLTLFCSRADAAPLLSLTADAVVRDAQDGHADALARWFSPADIDAGTDAVRYAAACLARTLPGTYAEALRTLAAFEVLDRLATIDVPVRVIATGRDLVNRAEDAAAIADRLPQGELRVVADAGPLLPVEDPDRFVGLLDHLAA